MKNKHIKLAIERLRERIKELDLDTSPVIEYIHEIEIMGEIQGDYVTKITRVIDALDDLERRIKEEHGTS